MWKWLEFETLKIQRIGLKIGSKVPSKTKQKWIPFERKNQTTTNVVWLFEFICCGVLVFLYDSELDNHWF
jgi:hypothetical protein